MAKPEQPPVTKSPEIKTLAPRQEDVREDPPESKAQRMSEAVHKYEVRQKAALAAAKNGESLSDAERADLDLTREEMALVIDYANAKEAARGDRKQLDDLRKKLFGLDEGLSSEETSSEEQDVRSYFENDDREHMQTSEYRIAFNAAVESLVMDEGGGINQTEYTAGRTQKERRFDADPTADMEFRLRDFVKKLERNPVMLSQFVHDMEMCAIDAAFNTESVVKGKDGQPLKVIDRLGKGSLFPSIKEHRNKEMFAMLEQTAQEAQQQRDEHYKGVDKPKRFGAERAERVPPYKKMDLDEQLKAKVFAPDMDDMEFVRGLLNDAQMHLTKVAKLDAEKAKGGVLGNVLKSSEKARAEDRTIEFTNRRAKLMSAYSTIMNIVEGRVVGNATNIDQTKKKTALALELARKIQSD